MPSDTDRRVSGAAVTNCAEPTGLCSAGAKPPAIDAISVALSPAIIRAVQGHRSGLTNSERGARSAAAGRALVPANFLAWYVRSQARCAH